jgi:hypothetical protein
MVLNLKVNAGVWATAFTNSSNRPKQSRLERLMDFSSEKNCALGTAEQEISAYQAIRDPKPCQWT